MITLLLKLLGLKQCDKCLKWSWKRKLQFHDNGEFSYTFYLCKNCKGK